MSSLFTIVPLIAILSLIVWWSVHEIQPTQTPEATDTQTESVPQDTIVTPVEKATEVKQQVESRNLVSLDLSGQGLTKVPSYVFERTNLEVLNLSNNKLDGALQAEVRHLQNLRSLNLSNNNFTGVPAEIGQLQNLEVLNLSNNQLTGLPYELGNLSNLKQLNLSGNNYSQFDLGVIKKSLPAGTVIITNN